MYEAGVDDDKFSMIYHGNRSNEVSIKTPIGPTKRVQINDIMTQGGSLAPSACSVQTDKIGKEALEREEYVYKYRNKISVPSLTMVDDILTISDCGLKSVESNAFVNSKIEMKKLTLNTDKYSCRKK